MLAKLRSAFKNQNLDPKKPYLWILGICWLGLGIYFCKEGVEILWIYIDDAWPLLPQFKTPVQMAYQDLILGLMAVVVAFLLLVRSKHAEKWMLLFFGVVALRMLYNLIRYSGYGILGLFFILLFVPKVRVFWLFLAAVLISVVLDSGSFYIFGNWEMAAMFSALSLLLVQKKFSSEVRINMLSRLCVLLISVAHEVLGWLFPLQ